MGLVRWCRIDMPFVVIIFFFCSAFFRVYARERTNDPASTINMVGDAVFFFFLVSSAFVHALYDAKRYGNRYRIVLIRLCRTTTKIKFFIQIINNICWLTTKGHSNFSHSLAEIFSRPFLYGIHFVHSI